MKDCAIQFWLYWYAMQVAATKILRLSEEAATKYRQVVRFTMGLHAIHVQTRRDPEKQWLATQYKLTNEEMDALVDECPATWRELVSAEEVSHVVAGPPPNAPVDQAQVQQSDQDSEEASSRTSTDSEMDRWFEETRTKKRQEQDEASGTTPMVDEQVNRIITAITTTTNASEASLR